MGYPPKENNETNPDKVIERAKYKPEGNVYFKLKYLCNLIYLKLVFEIILLVTIRFAGLFALGKLT